MTEVMFEPLLVFPNMAHQNFNFPNVSLKYERVELGLLGHLEIKLDFIYLQFVS